MGNAKYIGRVGALAVALGVGNVRRAATWMTVSLGAAAVVVAATVVPAPVSTVSPAVRLSADSTALIMCGTTCPTPDEFWIESVKSQFVAPTHPGQDIDYVAATTPEEYWPITGLFRLAGSAVGDPSVWGPGGPGWPDEPWWKLSGLFDLTIDQSIRAGVADLEMAMTKYGNDHLVIFGDSQAAAVAILEKRKLAEQYPAGTAAPDIQFVLAGDTNLPNGGVNARFPGLYIPVLDLSFNGPEPTNTQFHTDVITRQYDGAADFPLYPLNVIATLNALLGFLYLHSHPFDVSLAPDASTSPAYQGTHGDTSYYFFDTQDLPLFAPLRMLGVPEPFIDVVEPFFRVLVELGYDRSISPWEPTPARLIPPLKPVPATTDLVEAIGEGINNALALTGSPPPLSMPAPVTLAAPATETAKADISSQVMSTGASTDLAPSTTKVNETVSVDVTQQLTPTEAVSESDQVTSAKIVAETADANDASAGSTAASVPEPSASASTPKPAKPRRVVRDSLGATGTTAADPATAAGSSSASSSSATSPSAASSSPADDSSGDDAGGVN